MRYKFIRSSVIPSIELIAPSNLTANTPIPRKLRFSTKIFSLNHFKFYVDTKTGKNNVKLNGYYTADVLELLSKILANEEVK